MSLARALARGIESQGHSADVFDGDRDSNVKLTGYQYIAIGAEPLSSLSGRVPERVARFLSGAGMLSGKRSFAFVARNTLGAGRALGRLMKSMEKEGMLIKNSEVFATAQAAEETGRKLHVQR